MCVRTFVRAESVAATKCKNKCAYVGETVSFHCALNSESKGVRGGSRREVEHASEGGNKHALRSGRKGSRGRA